MKKSVEILGLPIISITEGRELGLSKSLLIDAKNGVVAAITIEDEDWYRGIKLIPYESIIALGEDAVTITHSENILNLDEAGDYERLLVENIRVIGTKAITKSGRIQGIVSEVFIGKGGKIEQCEITASDGSVSSVTADQISIFGKQVTVVNLDDEKKNSLIQEPPAFEPAYTSFHEEIPADIAEPVAEVEIPAEITEPVAEVEIPAEVVEPVAEVEIPAEVVEPVAEVEIPAEVVEPVAEVEIPADIAEPVAEVEIPAEVVEPVAEVEIPAEVVEPVAEVEIPAEVVEPVAEVEIPAEVVEPVAEVEIPAEVVEPVAEVKPSVAEVETPSPTEDEQKLASITQQAADLKAALKKAKAGQKKSDESKPQTSQRSQVERAVDERRRRVLLGKHATKTIITENGITVVESGAEVTEEVLQRARLANKFIELSMNVQ